MSHKLGCLLITALFSSQVAASAGPMAPIKEMSSPVTKRRVAPAKMTPASAGKQATRTVTTVVREEAAVLESEKAEILKAKPAALYTESDDIG